MNSNLNILTSLTTILFSSKNRVVKCLNKQTNYSVRIIFGIILTVILLSASVSSTKAWWDIRSVDTMKLSRDMAREYLDDGRDEEIEAHVKLIADTGASHIALGTPYDKEFSATLIKWVAAARKHNLKVWFRGNWSGWEEWFEYPAINRQQHIAKTKEFILNYPDLFEDGDIFSACPECENGGPGDPRQTGDVEGYRKFLIDEHTMMEETFKKIDKDVNFSVNSMNGDVARLIMNKETTKALGGIVSVDHYVLTPQKLADDVREIAKNSGGKVFLGEMGAPIPDIHGSMTDKQQAEWLNEALHLLSQLDVVVGINYWTGKGGSTAIWNSNNNPRSAVEVLRSFYKPEKINGTVVGKSGKELAEVVVKSQAKEVQTDENGAFVLPYLEKEGNVIFSKPGYHDQVIPFSDLNSGVKIELQPLQVHWLEHLNGWFFFMLNLLFNFS